MAIQVPEAKANDRKRSGVIRSYLDPDFLAGRPAGTCCRGCAGRDGCPPSSWGGDAPGSHFLRSLHLVGRTGLHPFWD
jgi:hypothetical protein